MMWLGGLPRLSRDSLLKNGWKSTRPCQTRILLRTLAAIVRRSCSVERTTCPTILGRSCWLATLTDGFKSGPRCHELNTDVSLAFWAIGFPDIANERGWCRKHAKACENLGSEPI